MTPEVTPPETIGWVFARACNTHWNPECPISPAS